MKTRESESDHPRLLTSSARNDAAVGLFVGFVSTLLVVTALFWLADRLAPHSAGGVSWATFRHETLVRIENDRHHHVGKSREDAAMAVAHRVAVLAQYAHPELHDAVVLRQVQRAHVTAERSSHRH